MVTKYYCLYGVRIGNVDDIADRISMILEIDFVRRHSSYSGDYCSYIGDLANEMIVRNNYNRIENEWREEEFKEYDVLIYVANSLDKNTEKKNRSEYIKQIFNHDDIIHVLRERVIES